MHNAFIPRCICASVKVFHKSRKSSFKTFFFFFLNCLAHLQHIIDVLYFYPYYFLTLIHDIMHEFITVTIVPVSVHDSSL